MMDNWNRYPIQDETPQEPVNNGEQPSAPQEPETPVQPSVTPPSYSSYGWQQPTSPIPPMQPPKKRRPGAAVIISIVCVVVIGILSGLLLMAYYGMGDWNANPSTPGGNSNPVDTPRVEIIEPDETADGLTAREIVSRNIDSTVLLKTYRTTVAGGSGFPFGQGGLSQEVQAGSASGIIMTADGYIITNWHCVIDEDTDEPFSRIDITLYDGTVYENATVIGADSSTDLAVIKVDAKDLKPAEFGDSTALQLGDRVIALGNAGGLGFSATQGIVSGLARDVYDDTGYAIKCLQVDAAINPGNSGGPLFNALGQVVAVNSAKIVAEGYEGLGFAIPISEAKAIVDQLIANGYVSGRVSLGITGQTYSDAYYQGFLIYTIEEGSSLRGTDVRRGDLIVGVNDVEVTDYATLRAALAKHNVGDTVRLKLLRSSDRKVQSFEVDVVLGEAKQ